MAKDGFNNEGHDAGGPTQTVSKGSYVQVGTTVDLKTDSPVSVNQKSSSGKDGK